jgi:hypothetical protein
MAPPDQKPFFAYLDGKRYLGLILPNGTSGQEVLQRVEGPEVLRSQNMGSA